MPSSLLVQLHSLPPPPRFPLITPSSLTALDADAENYGGNAVHQRQRANADGSAHVDTHVRVVELLETAISGKHANEKGVVGR